MDKVNNNAGFSVIKKLILVFQRYMYSDMVQCLSFNLSIGILNKRGYFYAEGNKLVVIIVIIIIIIQLVIKADQASHRHLEIHVQSLKKLRLISVSDKTMANQREIGLSGVQLYLHL